MIYLSYIEVKWLEKNIKLLTKFKKEILAQHTHFMNGRLYKDRGAAYLSLTGVTVLCH